MIKKFAANSVVEYCRPRAVSFWYIPVNHGFWLPIDADIFYFFNQKLVESKAFFVAGCIDQQSRLRRLFTAGDGYVDAEFLAERKRPLADDVS